MADHDICQRCGGPYWFDTTVPSPVWNAVVRTRGGPEFLCLTCVVELFVRANTSFTATLWGHGFKGVPLEVRIGGAIARDAFALSEENTRLRAQNIAYAREFNQLRTEKEGAMEAVIIPAGTVLHFQGVPVRVPVDTIVETAFGNMRLLVGHHYAHLSPDEPPEVLKGEAVMDRGSATSGEGTGGQLR